MQPASHPRRIALFGLTAIALVGAALAILHRTGTHKVVAAPVLAKQVAMPPISSPEQPPIQQQEQPATAATDDATIFAAAADMETSQLRDGFTLADWMNLPGKSESDGWERTPDKKLGMTDWPHKECLSYVKKETLPSGTELVRGLYFYPPPAPSPAVFPNLSGPELLKGCVLAIVRVEAASSRSDFEPQRVGEERAAEFARPIDQAVQERFTKKYGKSVGMEGVPFWGPGDHSYQDAARWIPNAEIVSGYDVKGGHMPDEDALVFPPFVFVHGRLPLVQEWQLNIGRAHRDPAKEDALFHQAVAAAGVGAAVSQRMEKLYQVDTTLADRLEKKVEEMCTTHCVPKELPRPKKDDWGEPIVPLLQEWFKALQTADPAHRAAGLLAADRVLIAFGSVRPWDRFGDVQSSTPEQSKRRSDLQTLAQLSNPPMETRRITTSATGSIRQKT
jgi:hypothetical protein